MRKGKVERTISSDTYDIMIGKNSKIDGDISSDGSVRIEGIVNGDITTEGDLIIGPESSITGNVKCRNVEISGSVKGNVTCKGSLKVYDNGSLIGDIEVSSFNIEQGGIFDGNCKINANVVFSPSTEE